MLAISALALGLAGLTAAAPVTSTDSSPNPQYPATAQSQGFYLVVNVTDPSRDLLPSVQNNYITSIHTGAGLAIVGVSGNSAYARTFYQNGTAQEYRYGQSTVISDGGATLPSPFGLSLKKDNGSETVSTLNLNGGAGTPGIRTSTFPEPYAFLLPETYVVCNEPLDYYHGTRFNIVKQADTTNADGTINYNIPDGCAPVRLLPQCTTLNILPSDSYSSHEFALQTSCYEDVSSINWSQYGP